MSVKKVRNTKDAWNELEIVLAKLREKKKIHGIIFQRPAGPLKFTKIGKFGTKSTTFLVLTSQIQENDSEDVIFA